MRLFRELCETGGMRMFHAQAEMPVLLMIEDPVIFSARSNAKKELTRQICSILGCLSKCGAGDDSGLGLGWPG